MAHEIEKQQSHQKALLSWQYHRPFNFKNVQHKNVCVQCTLYETERCNISDLWCWSYSEVFRLVFFLIQRITLQKTAL